MPLSTREMMKKINTLVQCDFDGTVTEEDVSFLLLDNFGAPNWRDFNKDYEEGKITVGQFNSLAFSTVKADKKTMLELVREKAKVREGFTELVDACKQNGFRFVIVSNGLRFYIEDILRRLGLGEIEVHAAETEFLPEGVKTHFKGPTGAILDKDFKLAYAESFHKAGYRVAYVGDGSSDVGPAGRSHHIFATNTLLKRCREEGYVCTPFTDLKIVAETIREWK